MERRIILNRIKTPDGTILTSYHRHDYVTYIDANGYEYMVDGGTDYLRRNLNEEAPYEDLTVYSDSPWETIRESVYRGSRGKDGTEPLKWVPLSEMSDAYVKACIEYNNERQLADSFANSLYNQELAWRATNNISIKE